MVHKNSLPGLSGGGVLLVLPSSSSSVGMSSFWTAGAGDVSHNTLGGRYDVGAAFFSESSTDPREVAGYLCEYIVAVVGTNANSIDPAQIARKDAVLGALCFMMYEFDDGGARRLVGVRSQSCG